jgi:hypothetical protein
VRVVGALLTFHFVCFGWLLFRANSIAHVRELLARLPISTPVTALYELASIGPAPPDALMVDLGTLVISIAVLLVAEELFLSPRKRQVPAMVRTLAFAALGVWVFALAVQTHTPFIYFQF